MSQGSGTGVPPVSFEPHGRDARATTADHAPSSRHPTDSATAADGAWRSFPSAVVAESVGKLTVSSAGVSIAIRILPAKSQLQTLAR